MIKKPLPQHIDYAKYEFKGILLFSSDKVDHDKG